MAASAASGTAVLPGSTIMAVAVMFMMVTLNIRIIRKFPCQQGVYRFVRTAGHTSVQTDSCACKRILRPCADTTAN